MHIGASERVLPKNRRKLGLGDNIAYQALKRRLRAEINRGRTNAEVERLAQNLRHWNKNLRHLVDRALNELTKESPKQTVRSRTDADRIRRQK